MPPLTAERSPRWICWCRPTRPTRLAGADGHVPDVPLATSEVGRRVQMHHPGLSVLSRSELHPPRGGSCPPRSRSRPALPMAPDPLDRQARQLLVLEASSILKLLATTRSRMTRIPMMAASVEPQDVARRPSGHPSDVATSHQKSGPMPLRSRTLGTAASRASTSAILGSPSAGRIMGRCQHPQTARRP